MNVTSHVEAFSPLRDIIDRGAVANNEDFVFDYRLGTLRSTGEADAGL